MAYTSNHGLSLRKSRSELKATQRALPHSIASNKQSLLLNPESQQEPWSMQLSLCRSVNSRCHLLQTCTINQSNPSRRLLSQRALGCSKLTAKTDWNSLSSFFTLPGLQLWCVFLSQQRPCLLTSCQGPGQLPQHSTGILGQLSSEGKDSHACSTHHVSLLFCFNSNFCPSCL